MGPEPTTEELHNLPRIYGNSEQPKTLLNNAGNVTVRKAGFKMVPFGHAGSFCHQLSFLIESHRKSSAQDGIRAQRSH